MQLNTDRFRWCLSVVLLGWLGGRLLADAPTNWFSVVPAGTGKTVFGLHAVKGEVLVAPGRTGSIFNSFDGSLWAEATNKLARPVWDYVEVGGTVYGAAGGDGSILTSDDGITWANHSVNVTHEWRSLIYGGGQFLAVGDGIIDTSTDSTNWTLQNVAPFDRPIPDFCGAAFVNDHFVALSAPRGAWLSPDGVNWTQQPIDPGPNPIAEDTEFLTLRYLNGKCFALGRGNDVGIGVIATSDDGGSSWTTQKPNGSTQFNDMAFANNRYVVVGSGAVGYSEDGLNWNFDYAFTSANLVGVAYLKGQFVALSSDGFPFTSADGIHWDSPNFGANNLTAVTATDSGFVAVGWRGAILTSTNGIDWTRQNSGTLQDLFGVGAGGGLVVATGAQADILTSPDGQAWTLRYSNTNVQPYYLKGVAYGQGTFVTAGGFLSSTNGLSWTDNSDGGPNHQLGVIFDGTTFFQYGPFPLLSSTNGTEWPANLEAVRGQGMAYGGGHYVCVDDPAVYVSTNGVRWTSVNLPSPNLLAITYAEGAFVAVGRAGKVAYSTNGTNWTTGKINTTFDLHSIAYKDGTYVAVGDSGTLFYSTREGERLTLQRFLNAHGFQFGFSGTPGKPYKVQYTTDLQTWQDLGSITPSRTVERVLDRSAADSSSRQYRVVEQ